MICADIITKEDFSKFLKSVLISKRDLNKFMIFFNDINDVELHEKIMFLLYNEYLSIYDIFAIYDDNNITDKKLALIDITNTFTFDNPYANIRDTLFRDNVTTLLFFNYENRMNISNQLDIIYQTLTQYEQQYLELKGFNINNFIDLVRIQSETNDGIELAEVEKTGEKLNKITAILNSTGKFPDSNGEFEANIMKSVLKKISIGTIH